MKKNSKIEKIFEGDENITTNKNAVLSFKTVIYSGDKYDYILVIDTAKNGEEYIPSYRIPIITYLTNKYKLKHTNVYLEDISALHADPLYKRLSKVEFKYDNKEYKELKSSLISVEENLELLSVK